MKRSINDILNGPIQGQAGIEWAHELQWAVREALKMVFTRDEMIVEYMKERDALQAKLDAVPVKEIKYYVDVTEPEYELMAYWEDNRPVFENAQNAIKAWVKDVQP